MSYPFGIAPDALDNRRGRIATPLSPVARTRRTPIYDDGNYGAPITTPMMHDSTLTSAPNMTSPAGPVATPAPMLSGPEKYKASHTTGWMSSLSAPRDYFKTSAPTFAAAKAAGVDDKTARSQAYTAAHGGQSMYAPPTPTPAAPIDPKVQKSQNAATERYFSGLMSQSMREITAAKNNASARATAQARYNDARDRLNQHRASQIDGGTAPSPTGPPAPPSMIPPPQAAPSAPSFPGMFDSAQQAAAGGGSALMSAPGMGPNVGGKANIPMSPQIARQMYATVMSEADGADPDHIRDLWVDRMRQYGVPPQESLLLHKQWTTDGTLGQRDFQRTPDSIVPGVRIPLSRLGPDNGLDPSQNYGGTPMSAPRIPGIERSVPDGPTPTPFARQSVPGPYISAPATVRPGEVGPEMGFTPLAQGADTQAPTPAPRAPSTPIARQQQPAQSGAVALRLRNGRTVYRQADGSFVDEQGRLIRQ